MFGIRYYYVNNIFTNYTCNYYKCNENITYNNVDIVVTDQLITDNDGLKNNYNVSQNFVNEYLSDCANNNAYIICKIKIKNNSTTESYLDFTHFIIKVDNWFSWTSFDLFKEINPKLKNNLRVCIYPNIESEIYLPFSLYY